MAFWCSEGGERHQHESIAEMRSAHSSEPAKESDSAASTSAVGTHLPASPEPPAARDSVAPSPSVTETLEERRKREAQWHDWIGLQPWNEGKKGDARKHLLMNRRDIESIDWTAWSDEWDAVVAVDAYGRVVNEPRLKLIKAMIEMIPDGYYAAQADEGGHVDFVMISRPNRGNYKDHIKVSTQHSENWTPRLALMPNGRWLVLDRRAIEPLMMIVSDYRTCARRYAIELQHCCVCNTQLTDDRSRHYLIGPVCDKKPQWAHVIEEVDDINDGLSYEALVARGMPTRVWQERISL